MNRMPAIVLLTVLAPGLLGAGSDTGRTVAVTFDDLPGPPAGLVSNAPAALRENTKKLLAAVRAHRIPAVGFVNEDKLVVEGQRPQALAARTAVLEMWLDAGLELGNHTYSHPSLNSTPLADFEADLIRGEAVTKGLIAARGAKGAPGAGPAKLRWFRHPFLHVGLDLEKRRAFETFLAARGYTVAPVTIDDDDYIYAAVYADALRRGDKEFAARIGTDYVRYMESVFATLEDASRQLTGREIRQVLLLHANTLNADWFDRVAAMLEARGYHFVTLDEALEDEAYRLPDTYVGPWGISWIHHWEITAGRKRTPSPDPPDWILKPYHALGY